MKNLQANERPAQRSAEIVKEFMTINRLIHSSEKREQGYELLSILEKEELSPEEQVYCHYLNARYYLASYMEDYDIEQLEYAHDFLNDLVQLAFDNNVRISNPWIHYTRANVKFMLAQVVWEEERIDWLLIKARKIVGKVVRLQPQNEDFLRLQKQLAA
jgi:hypothetical protein